MTEEAAVKIKEEPVDYVVSANGESEHTKVGEPDPPKTTSAPPGQDEDDDDEDLFGGDEEDDEDVRIKVEDTEAPEKATDEAAPTESAAVTEPDAAASSSTLGNSVNAAVEPEKSPETSLAIPRKVHRVDTPAAPPQNPASRPAASAPEHHGDPSRFGLPAGVRVPASITSALLSQGKLLETIKSLPVNLINDALTEYDDAVQIKGSSIRNHGAYLFGVCKRYCSVHERAAAGEGSGILPMGEALTDTVNRRLEQLVYTNFCSREEMNDKVKSKIRMLSEKDALFALDELASVERSSIRNFGSYFMGILNRYMRGDATSKIRPPPTQPPYQPPSPRGRDRSYRDSGPPSYYARDRSRDRFEDRQRGSGDYGNTGGGYDPRQRKGGWDSQPWNKGNNNNRTSMPPPFPQHQQQHQPSGPPPGPPMPPGGPYGPPQGRQYGAPPFVPQQAQYGSNQQQPPPQYGASQPPMQQPPPPYAPNQQQPPPPYAPNQQQPPLYPPNQQQPPPYPPNQQQQFAGNQQQAPAYGSTYPPQQSSMQQPPSNLGGVYQQQQQPPNPSQAPYMANQPPFVPNQAQPPMMNPHQQQQSYNMGQPPQPPQLHGAYQSAPAAGWPSQPQQQQQVDILGLADKAASAVQALASQSKMNNNNYGAPAGPPFAPYGQPPQQGSSFPPQQDHGGRRRRTTAGLSELPVNVQYAVHNLVATGTVDGPLDDGMLGMIFDLPEDLALAALQKFASIDKRTMRNKTAYLAGVLRRELERINKR